MYYKNTLLISLVSYSVIFNSVNGDREPPSVIIIGAGAAGIAAASKLFQNGFTNITILEAEERIGGRLYTTQFGGYLVDLGGQWVHGEIGNVAYELAFPLGLLEKDYFTNRIQELYDSSGTLVDQRMTNDILEFYMQISQKNFTEKLNVSIGELATNELNKYLEAHPDWKKNSKGVLQMFEMDQLAIDGADSWFDVSISGTSEFYHSPGDTDINWKERAYGFILDILMKRYPRPEEELPVVKNTLLNTEVALINNKDTSGKKVAVTTINGNTYFADHAIVTTSLGVLKEQHLSLFQPSLSEEKIKAIKALGFGSEAKIFLSFEEPWWTIEATRSGLYFLWKDEDIVQLENDPEKSWLLGLLGFYFVEHKPRLLCGWVSGKHARDMEKLTEQQVFNHTVEALQRFVGEYYNVTMPNGMTRSMWNSNKHFKGTYSYRSMKADADNVWHATLAEPIGGRNPVILFAGEATNPHYFGTVNGAIASGWREADRLIQFYSNLEKVNGSTPS
ncbi:spermine oxidase-like [Belonocnema kinseyi]|uniref:spermine oxidase-like n=1 Tax=Belonocnema kinseyi TaxID=2817044 RepID=UPI00143D2265|nr:spermine oxidase-like [Belonocnema kinseyi]